MPSPDQIAILTAIVNLLGKWPVWASMSLLIVVGPWIALALVGRYIERNNERRFEAVVKMYESNVSLVEKYDALVASYNKITDDYRDLISLTTQVMTELKDLIKNNLYCPWVRKQTRPEEDIRG